MRKFSVLFLTLSFLFSGRQALSQNMTEQVTNSDKYNSYSIGIRAVHLLDLPANAKSSRASSDLKGYNGANTRFDMGVDIFGEKHFNPLLGIQMGFRYAGLSGANTVEYYRNTFFEVYTDLLVQLTNFKVPQINNRLNAYAKFGLGTGSFNAKQYLSFDDEMDDHTIGGFWEGHMGAGVNCQINNQFRIDFELMYNAAFSSGFDGYDGGGGLYPYLTTAVGVTYTFGSKDASPMYSATYIDGLPKPAVERSTTTAKVEENAGTVNSGGTH